MRILKTRISFFTLVLAAAFQYTTQAQTANVNVQQNELIPELLEEKTRLTKDGKLGERYQIQLYYGDNQTASDVIRKFRTQYNTWPSQIIYETPNYKVWVGNFRNRLEADRALLKIKQDYPAAFIPKPQRG
ncbi:SPOR domain-containing protein [Antarcticibacterium flavum]|uniref:SPOR domain-containing protein n=1 Tax=Antarcticibacterium flavum TaxID=2058175 RepID=A0A5B7X3P0_9FLAO|nr:MULTISPECIES: SPOR domain-containing protein [Antarcticibacterium]MCM4158342.1 translation initiation factor IF-2 [Antarcticibacterium sp. W02-3]QCY70106.1 SPOR domain-containing protein [Antarcticibacterium flavum]